MMSNNAETHEVEGESETGVELVEALGDVLPDLTGVPLPPMVKRSFWKAAAHLIMGLADLPAAWLEGQAGRIRTEGAARNLVTMGAATAAAARFGAKEELADRAVQHFASRIVKEQINREEVAKIAAEELKQDPPLEDAAKEIEEDWLNQFADIAAKVSNAEMRTYLGKILAGEIREPGSFSPASIITLTTLSQVDAQHFQRLCDISMRSGTNAFVLAAPYGSPGENALLPLGLSYDSLCDLRVAGLLNPDLTSKSDFDDWPYTIPFDFCGRLAAFRSKDLKPRDLGGQKTVFLSRAGSELRQILSMKPDPRYVAKLQEWLDGYESELVFFTKDKTPIRAEPD